MRRVLLSLALLMASSSAHALTLERDTRWSGEQRVTETVHVAAGVTLEIAPGTRVHFAAGGLEVSGRLVARQAQFTGQGWDGLTLKGCDGATRLEQVAVRGARTGILVQGGAPQLLQVTVSDNDVGVELRGKTLALLRDSTFRGNRKVGLFVKDDSTPSISGCSFSNQGKFGAYLYRATPQQFAGNRFTGNPVGLMVAYYGSDPLIEENDFSGNEIGIEVDRAARPQLRGNRLQDNRVGLFLQRRADPLVAGNRFAGNDVAIKVAYSSYPRITGNDFVANPLAIQLEFQSSTWEREQGATARAQEVSSQGAFGGQGGKGFSEEERRPLAVDGTVDARGNWWGDAGNLELARQGEQGNPSFIHDGHDQPTFVEQGKSYPLDRVVFAPWSAMAHLRGAP